MPRAQSQFASARELFAEWRENELGRDFVNERYAVCCLELGRLRGDRSLVEEALLVFQKLRDAADERAPSTDRDRFDAVGCT
jgi:hypothetical protein